jgi:hypothetical protein
MKSFVCTLLAASLFLSLTTSCGEDQKELSDVAILVSPKAEARVAIVSGEKARYQIEFFTTHQQVTRLKVRSFNAVEGELVLKDTTFASKPTIYDFVYAAPFVSRDSLEVLLTFEAWDNEGHKCDVRRTLMIKNQSVIIAEKSGIVLWSPQSGRSDALSFDSPSQTFSWQHSPDSVRADLYLTADADFQTLDFQSNTKAKFIRNNSFDYASATALTIQAVYESSYRSDRIDQLQINDIILVGHSQQAEGVLRIQNIIRQGSEADRCIQLAFKGIKTN